MLEPTRLQPLSQVNARARAYFMSDATRPLAFRLEKLRALGAAIREFEPQILAAMKSDLGKGEVEAYTSEIAVVMKDLNLALKKLSGWMKPRGVSTQLHLLPGRSQLLPEPLGVALIIAPWNYPMNLLLGPLVGAMAAGCTAVLKPSELAPATEQVMEAVVKRALGDDGYVTIARGGVEVSERLLLEKWDHIFFTGSTRVGKLVMGAAAKHLTPVTLELGGKNPTLVDEGVDLDITARRIVWGTFYNAGQTCLACDYVLAHKSIKDALVEKLVKTVREFYGDDPAKSPVYSRIVNASHVRRIAALLQTGNTGKVMVGGTWDEAERYFAPTVVVDPALDTPLMSDEIFGPILPVMGVDSWSQAVDLVRLRPRPLAAYGFTNDAAHRAELAARTSSGALVFNDAVVHFASSSLPFGGVGDSGMGGYHGKASFDAFTHFKPVLTKYFFADMAQRYPNTIGSIAFWKRILG